MTASIRLKMLNIKCVTKFPAYHYTMYSTCEIRQQFFWFHTIHSTFLLVNGSLTEHNHTDCTDK